MQQQSFAISPNLFLATVSMDALATVIRNPTVHRIFVCDASGSMDRDLHRLRRHLKNNLSLTVADGDLVTLLWFSGRGQYGVIFEGMPVHDASDLASMHGAIDRYLVSVGLTGFKEPLEETARCIARLRERDPHAVFSLVFMSDGYDNQWRQEDVLAAAAALGDDVSAGAVVEYGWYANRPLLTKMAERIGVPYVFSEDFERFAPALDSEFRREVGGAKKRDVVLPGQTLHGICYTLRGDALASYSVVDGVVRVPEDVTELNFLSASVVGSVNDSLAVSTAMDDLPRLYAAMAVLSQRMLSDEVIAILKVLGDVRLIRMFANCFGKQHYSAFQEAATAVAFDPALRWTEGYDPDLVPPDDAYTVLDLLADLMQDERNLLHVSHEAFDYQRIGRKTESSGDRLTDEEKTEIADMTAAARSGADLARVQARMAEIVASKPRSLSFKANEEEAGVPLANLTFNENRPNVSVLVMRHGTVDVSGNGFGLPDSIETSTFRNYTVVKDGILNLKCLPVSLTQETHALLAGHGLVEGVWSNGTVSEIALDELPIVNRRMVSKVSATECFALQYELEKARAAQKVFKAFEEKHFPKESGAGFRALYGAEAAEWLKTVGVTDKGFSPKVVQAAASDVYMGREFKIAIAGLSSLPPVDQVIAKMAEGKKLTVSQGVMAPFVTECQAFVGSSIYADAADPQALLKTWIVGKSAAWTRRSRELGRRMSEIKFSIVVGQVWFPEFDSLDEGTLSITAEDGTRFTATATLKEIEVAI